VGFACLSLWDVASGCVCICPVFNCLRDTLDWKGLAVVRGDVPLELGGTLRVGDVSTDHQGVNLVDEQPQKLRRQLVGMRWWSRYYKNFDLESETLVTYIQVIIFLDSSLGTLSRSNKPLTVGTVQAAETPPLPPPGLHVPCHC
jgi:hypothetical protein